MSERPPEDTGERARPPRIVVVSSEAHRSSPDISETAVFSIGEHGMRDSIAWYGYSKLMLTAFTEELSRRHNPNSGARIAVITMCPGAMSTGIARDAPRAYFHLTTPKEKDPRARSPELAAPSGTRRRRWLRRRTPCEPSNRDVCTAPPCYTGVRGSDGSRA